MKIHPATRKIRVGDRVKTSWDKIYKVIGKDSNNYIFKDEDNGIEHLQSQRNMDELLKDYIFRIV